MHKYLSLIGNYELIEEIQKQWSNRKRHKTPGIKVDKIKGQIEENWKFVDQLGVKIHKSRTNDRFGKALNFKVDMSKIAQNWKLENNYGCN